MDALYFAMVFVSILNIDIKWIALMRNKFPGVVREQRSTTPIPAEKMAANGSQIVIKRLRARSCQPF